MRGLSIKVDLFLSRNFLPSCTAVALSTDTDTRDNLHSPPDQSICFCLPGCKTQELWRATACIERESLYPFANVSFRHLNFLPDALHREQGERHDLLAKSKFGETLVARNSMSSFSACIVSNKYWESGRAGQFDQLDKLNYKGFLCEHFSCESRVYDQWSVQIYRSISRWPIYWGPGLWSSRFSK